MSTKLIAVIIMLMLVVSASTVFADAMQRPAARGPGYACPGLGMDIGPRLVRELGLTQDQVTQLQRIRDEFMTATKDKRDQLKAKKQEMITLLTAATPDAAAIKALASEIETIKTDIHNTAIDYMISGLQVLTPAQREKLRTLLREHPEYLHQGGYGKRGDGMGKGPEVDVPAGQGQGPAYSIPSGQGQGPMIDVCVVPDTSFLAGISQLPSYGIPSSQGMGPATGMQTGQEQLGTSVQTPAGTTQVPASSVPSGYAVPAQPGQGVAVPSGQGMGPATGMQTGQEQLGTSVQTPAGTTQVPASNVPSGYAVPGQPGQGAIGSEMYTVPNTSLPAGQGQGPTYMYNGGVCPAVSGETVIQCPCY